MLYRESIYVTLTTMDMLFLKKRVAWPHSTGGIQTLNSQEVKGGTRIKVL